MALSTLLRFSLIRMRFGGKHSLSRNGGNHISNRANAGTGVRGWFARVCMPPPAKQAGFVRLAEPLPTLPSGQKNKGAPPTRIRSGARLQSAIFVLDSVLSYATR